MTTTTTDSPGGNRDWALPAIVAVLALYGASFAWGLPQRWTAAVTAGHEEGAEHGVAAPSAEREELADAEEGQGAHQAAEPPNVPCPNLVIDNADDHEQCTFKSRVVN